MSTHELPVAVIGAGPVGLAAAAHLVSHGIAANLYEAGASVAANVASWGHVRLFSPWRLNIDPAARALLHDHGWQEPPGDALPTGQDLLDGYLEPLASVPAIAQRLHTKTRVLSVGRQGADKVVTRERAARPFALTVANGSGPARIELARAVIDASGTWQNPNPLGASGNPAIGEREHHSRIAFGVPDVLRHDRATYADRRVLVVGGGHSAANVLLDLARLCESEPQTHITWAVRGESLARVIGGGRADKLAARGKLGLDLAALMDAKRIELVLGFGTESVQEAEGGVTVTGTGGRVLGPFDRIVVATGQRPDLDMTRELRLDLDPWLECPRALGPMIDPNLHSCGTVPPHGYRELAHPEPDYFAVGIKSYGRAPTFLMATGYEQVRSVTALLAGDEAAANHVRLVLPETGVCSTDLAPAESAGCCGGPAPAVSDACCVADHEAKAAGASGCGCSEPAPVQPTLKASCCGATRA
jgi:thioredoxin reductase